MRILPAALAAAALVQAAVAASPQCPVSASSAQPRKDCGYFGITQPQCEAKGCCWSPSNQRGAPWCVVPAQKPTSPPQPTTQAPPALPDVTGYVVTKEIVKSKRERSLELQLSKGTAVHGKDLERLRVDVTYETADRVHIKIVDPVNQRYEIPQSVLPDPELPQSVPEKFNYEFSYSTAPFGFAVTRTSDKEVLFNTTTTKGLVYENQYLQISTILPESPNIYGFAERIDNLRLDLNKMYTMWSYDIPTPDHQNLYGVHPFYLEMRNGKAHAVFLKNSNAQEVFLESGLLTYFVTGGVLDFYILVGPSPDEATKQYHDVIGHPHMPPYWSLGWHQCRYGFHNISEIEGVVQGYKDNKIPLDTIWADIDHMDQYKDFSWDPVNFPIDEVNKFVDKLHAEDQQMVVIVDPGIHNQVGYGPYDEGVEKGLFVKRANGEIFLGKVWPGITAFPDFFNPNTTEYWSGLISEFLTKTPLDGLWIDMNEISNFCNGFCDTALVDELANVAAAAYDNSDFNPINPPYKINNANHQGPLNEKTLDMDCVHHGEQNIEYNVHSLFGLTEGIATKYALEKFYEKRSFILSRSTFPGSGKHVAHWLGDNHASFKSMRDSFPGAMLFNILGVPLVGSDICGFMEDANEELCNRWHAVGAFYPFARNHQALGTNFKYPYSWESVKKTSIKSLGARYSLLNYYYTLFYNAHMNGGTVMRPLFYEFPEDSNTYGIDQQFMIGSALLFSPCMTEGAMSVQAYFPKARWYDFWTNTELPSEFEGTTQTISTPWDAIPIYIRGGSILPTQTPALTSTETKRNPFTLTVALDHNNKAFGEIYIDDGDDLKVGAEAFQVNFAVEAAGKLSSSVVQNNYGPARSGIVERVNILGLQSAPDSVSVNGIAVKFSFDVESKALSVENLDVKLVEFSTLTWGHSPVSSSQ